MWPKMGFGELIRNITVTQDDSVTGDHFVETIVTGTGVMSDLGGSREFRGLLGVPAAWRATQLLSDFLGAIPWHAYEDQPNGTAIRRMPTPQLLEQPAGNDRRVTTYSSWCMDLIWNGNAVGIIWERDEFGEPALIVPVPAEYVFVKYANEGDMMPMFKPGEIIYMIGTKLYRRSDVLHVKGLCRPGALRGLGVLENFYSVLSLDIEQRKQARAATGAGIPLGVLQSDNPDLDQTEADEISAAWQAKQNARKVAVLNASTHFEALAWNPTEAQLLDARKFGNVEAAQIFGIDPSWLGAQQSSRVYTNVEQEGIELVRKSSLNGHLARFEQELSSHLRPGSAARANLDAVQRADTLARYQSYQIAVTTGFLTDDEIRALERYAPLTPEQRQQIKDTKPEPPAIAAPAKPGASGADDKTKVGAK